MAIVCHWLLGQVRRSGQTPRCLRWNARASPPKLRTSLSCRLLSRSKRGGNF